jgi:hypothetical protein
MLNHKVKSHIGHGPREKVWVLVIVDTSTSPGRGFVKIVENRSKIILVQLICQVFRCGSIKHSDEWKSYEDLGKINDYQHASVCHKYKIVCPSTGVHTQKLKVLTIN